ncbi:MAG: MFS transporter [Thermoleophilia bacterium]|nr:MFS transporter [Thermoleophilia bacterium]
MRDLLGIRGFRRFFLAQCASMLGDSIFLVALAFAVLEATGSAAKLGIVLAAGGVLLCVSFLVSGVWADRLPRLPIMITSDLVRLVSQLTLALLLATDQTNLAWLIALYGISAVATAFFMPARTGLIPQLLKPELLMRGNGLLSGAQRTLSIAGFAGGGLLVAVAGPAGAIAIDATSFAASALLLIGIGPLTSVVVTKREPFLRELADGWHEVTARRWLWLIVLLASLWLLLCEGPLQVIGPVVMRGSYDGAATWGLLGAALALGGVAGSLLAPSSRVPHAMVVCLVLFFATAIVPVLLIFEAPLWTLLTTSVIAGTSHGMFDTLWHGTLQRDVPADRLARVSAWDWMGSLALMPFGLALAGFAVEWVGTAPVLAAMAASGLVLNVVMLASRDVRTLGAQPVQLARFATDRTGRIEP